MTETDLERTENMIEWFNTLSYTDMLSLYEGCEKLGVFKDGTE